MNDGPVTMQLDSLPATRYDCVLLVFYMSILTANCTQTLHICECVSIYRSVGVNSWISDSKLLNLPSKLTLTELHLKPGVLLRWRKLENDLDSAGK